MAAATPSAGPSPSPLFEAQTLRKRRARAGARPRTCRPWSQPLRPASSPEVRAGRGRAASAAGRGGGPPVRRRPAEIAPLSRPHPRWRRLGALGRRPPQAPAAGARPAAAHLENAFMAFTPEGLRAQGPPRLRARPPAHRHSLGGSRRQPWACWEQRSLARAFSASPWRCSGLPRPSPASGTGVTSVGASGRGCGSGPWPCCS